MTRKSTISSRCWRPAGLTLIEVVASIAILGTILVGALFAAARHTRQLAHAQRCRLAVRAADELIATWWSAPAGVPVNESGAVPDDAAFTWRTTLIKNDGVAQLGARVVRIEILDASLPRRSPDETHAHVMNESAGPALITVEVVVPDPLADTPLPAPPSPLDAEENSRGQAPVSVPSLPAERGRL